MTEMCHEFGFDDDILERQEPYVKLSQILSPVLKEE
jgi:hypothetical protein